MDKQVAAPAASAPPQAPAPVPGETPELVKKYAWPENPAIVGTSVRRLDGPDKLTGRAKYTFDINRPGMLYGRIVRSPHPHARIVSIDLSEALQAPGVKAALHHKEPGAEVMYQGDAVAAVAADTEERAIDAQRLVRVQYQVLPHVANVGQAMDPDGPVVFSGGNTRAGAAQETGDLVAGFAQADQTVEGTYSTHVITHVCMEGHSAVCEWDGDKLTAWMSTQAVHGSAQQFAQALKDPADQYPCDHAAHGRRLRQQVADWSRRRALRPACAGREAAREADARSQGRAPGHRQPALGHLARQGRCVGRRPG